MPIDLDVVVSEIVDLQQRWLVLLDEEMRAGPGQADPIRREIEAVKAAIDRLSAIAARIARR